MDYNSLKAGRELDTLVAEKVFGIKYEFIHGDYCRPDPQDPIAYLVCPEYSMNIAAAFQVEERIQSLGLAEQYAYYLVETVIPGSAFGFLNRGAYENDIFAVAHASPEHRCIAALKAISTGGTTSQY